MMRSYAKRYANNLWTKRKMKKMSIILVGVVFIIFQINVLLITPQFKEKDSLPDEVFRTHKSNSIGSIYHREDFFLPNYATMEEGFKIFVYLGKNPTTCYDPKDKLKRRYASEHYFLKNLIPSSFFTDDPTEAHLFLIPFSCRKTGGRVKVLATYVKNLISTYPYWNRTLGADHFLFSCHGFGSKDFEEVPFLMKNAIRLVCSPSYDSNYIPQKDIALPQTLELALPDGDDVWSRSTVESRPLLVFPEMLLPSRSKLGFWAGSPNSDVRKNLLIFHKSVPEFDFHFISETKKAALLDAYQNELYGSKFCICPRGKNHAGGICLTELMNFGCIPVILSDFYDLPFNDVLDWTNFSVILKEDDVPDLEKILKGIPEENYKKMHQNLLQVD
ncbi:unnamed protein product [Dovyalis caffra]|uniref:Exostosin GT47 domain-containing protein n=1 Tax=Dovyalis caffra TaxID=77055 RepID=A0AAV1SR59_9ROSI|nr:unnamed protein product [Dovyalis caffra]